MAGGNFHRTLGRITVALSAVIVAALLRWMVAPWAGSQSGLILFIPAVMAATWYGGIWPGLAAMVLAAIAGESAEAHPAGIFLLQNHEGVRIVLFLCVGLQIAAGTELLHRRTREARAANQAKDHFIRMLSHELRTPITPALLTAASLASDPALPDSLREQLQLVQRNLMLEVRLIDDLLDISRIQKGKLQLKREIVGLEGILQEAVGTCRQTLADKHIDLRIHSEGDPHHVNADPARLQQIFWNLLRNAVKFTPDGGTIRINVTSADPGGVCVQISDTGMGIPRERLGKIFNAFEQGGAAVTRQFGGLGLGLAITRSLVELHGGTIRAASEGEGRGASFIVRLPVTAFPISRQPEESGRRAPARPRGLRILYVEDHLDTLQVMTRLLEKMGHHVTHAGSFHAALECAARENFDLLITDLSLPDGDGADLFPMLRSKKAVPYGVALTGLGMEDDIRRTRAAGYSAHLTKPLDIAELQRTLDTMSRKFPDATASAHGRQNMALTAHG